MKKSILKNPSFWISAVGLIALAAMYTLWVVQTPNLKMPGRIAAAVSAALFAIVCLRFVPRWMKFWKRPRTGKVIARALNERRPQVSWQMDLRIFITFFLLDVGIILLVGMMLKATGRYSGVIDGLEFWKCLDSASYLDIARDWYPTTGEKVVQLAFFPGYPLLVRLFYWIIGNDLYAGLLVSALCFSGAGCMVYRLLRLDFEHADAMRTLKYICILPGVFFYAAPMTESMFLLLCAACIYFARTGRWTFACLLGGIAAFTRSLGITLLVPLIMELVRGMVKGPRRSILHWAGRIASLLLVAAGLAGYLYVNYTVSGDPFKFQEYQSAHWGQRISYFFNTAAYQLDYAMGCYTSKPHNFLGLWLPNLIYCFGSLILMCFAAKKMRPSYVAWFILYFAVAIGATWLLSGPRYLMVMLPVPLAVSMLTKNPDADLAATPVCIGLGLLYTYAFVARWQVW